MNEPIFTLGSNSSGYGEVIITSGSQSVPARSAPPAMSVASLPRSARLKIERELLTVHFPKWKWLSSTCASGPVMSNSGKTYMLLMQIPPSFPHEWPCVYSLSELPSARDLRSPTHAMHTMFPNSAGNVQFCIFNERNWKSSVTLQHVLQKARYWLEAYEQHRRTGRVISEFLPSI